MSLIDLDIPALFEAAKAGDAGALGALSDAAGHCVGLEWYCDFDDEPIEYWRHLSGAHEEHGDVCDVWRTAIVTKEYHAPVRDLTCAASVPASDAYAITTRDLGTQGGVCRVDVSNGALCGLLYRDPAHRPLAEVSARLYANQHAMRTNNG